MTVSCELIAIVCLSSTVAAADVIRLPDVDFDTFPRVSRDVVAWGTRKSGRRHEVVVYDRETDELIDISAGVIVYRVDRRFLTSRVA